MNESTLKKLKCEAMEREVERERSEHVRLIGTIYVEPLALFHPQQRKLNFLSKNKRVGS
jgi:hypothetical protein